MRTKLPFFFLVIILACAEKFTPVFPKGERYIVCKADVGSLRNSEGDLIDLLNGDLLLAYSKHAFHNNDDDPGVIAAKISRDSGKTWSNDFVLQENIGMKNVSNPSFVRLKNGELLLFFLIKNNQIDCNLYFKKSVDEGKSWSSIKRVGDLEGYHVVNHNKVIQLNSGRIVVPVSYTPDVFEYFDSLKVFCYYSDDEGNTWERSNTMVTVPNSPSMEPAITEAGEGELLVVIRNDRKRIYHSISFDQGRTWRTATPLDLVSPSSPASIVKMPFNNKLLIVYNNSSKHRNPLSSSISQDNGRTWENVKVIENARNIEFAYTSIRFIHGKVYLTYYQTNPANNGTDLVLTIISPEWFESME